MAGVSISSLTERLLVSQLSPEETRRTLSRIKEVESCTGGEDKTSTARATATEALVENVQYFMPCIPESGTEDDSSPREGAQARGFSTAGSICTHQDPVWSRIDLEDATVRSPALDTTTTLASGQP